MGKLVVVNFMSLDGVVQSVLAADEDREGGFQYGGWVLPFVDETVARFMRESTVAAGGMLLGRKTYQIFAATWPLASEDDPAVAAMNRMPKYVASRTLTAGEWQNTTVLGADVVAEVAALKERPGGDIVSFGSAELLGTLARHDLVDEYHLLVFPLVLGRGKRMFSEDAVPVKLTLTGTTTSSTGVAIHKYERAGRWEPEAATAS